MMADASKLKSKRSRNSLGTPPGPDEVATSLNSPEVAPAVIDVPVAIEPDAVPVTESPVTVTTPQKNDSPYVRRDGRSARKTYRTLPFATRVTPEFDNDIRDIADREGLKLVEVLENAVAAYKKQQGY